MGVLMSAEADRPAGRGIDGFAGWKLRRLRELALLTQDELADAAGVSPGEVSHLECGRRQPTVLTLRGLCKALGVTPEKLMLTDDERTVRAATRAADAARADDAARAAVDGDAAGVPVPQFRDGTTAQAS